MNTRINPLLNKPVFFCIVMTFENGEKTDKSLIFGVNETLFL